MWMHQDSMSKNEVPGDSLVNEWFFEQVIVNPLQSKRPGRPTDTTHPNGKSTESISLLQNSVAVNLRVLRQPFGAID